MLLFYVKFFDSISIWLKVMIKKCWFAIKIHNPPPHACIINILQPVFSRDMLDFSPIQIKVTREQLGFNSTHTSSRIKYCFSLCWNIIIETFPVTCRRQCSLLLLTFTLHIQAIQRDSLLNINYYYYQKKNRNWLNSHHSWLVFSLLFSLKKRIQEILVKIRVLLVDTT